jgi:hypothetical protein
MSDETAKKVTFVVFVLLTLYLFYAHFNAKSNYAKQLEGMNKLAKGQGVKEKITLDDRYAVIGTKSIAAVVMPYTFTVKDKVYKGTITSFNKSANDLVQDSAYYLPEDPEINAAYPKEDYARLEQNPPWNWRLYVGIVLALICVANLKKDKGEKANEGAPKN